ncbi:MAG: CoA pyrophosphatase [Chloroflexi bacterium]|nr:CoA pyrophosphatase [Chloroflexota bacterium]
MFGEEPTHASPPRLAAVLVLAYPVAGVPHVVFTKRSETVANHQGQISLPGGAVDPGDASLEATALRETEEELGVEPAHVYVLGRLDDVYVYVSNFLIAPFVGALEYQPRFRPQTSEVAQVIDVPLDRLRDPSILLEDDWLLRGQSRRVQFYQHGPHQIWGATQRVIAEFLDSPYPEILASRFAVGPNPLPTEAG